MPVIQVLFIQFQLFFDILKAHEKLYKTMYLVQNVKTAQFKKKLPTYNPWFFLKIGPFLNIQTKHII